MPSRMHFKEYILQIPCRSCRRKDSLTEEAQTVPQLVHQLGDSGSVVSKTGTLKGVSTQRNLTTLAGSTRASMPRGQHI